MASNGVQSGQEDAPAFPEGDPPATGADYEEVARYAKFRGNSFKGTTAQRTGYAYAAEGHRWYDTTLDQEYLHDGSGWRLWHKLPTAYTPVLTNISGSPTITARYSIGGGRVFVSITMTLTGTNVGSAPGFSLPVTSRTPTGSQMLGQALYRKSSSWIEGGILLSTTTRVDPVLKLVSGAVIGMSTNVNATSPFTWASGDTMTLEFSYEAA